MYFDYFDASFFINLDVRVDRKILFEKRMSELGFLIPRYNAITINKEIVDSSNDLFKKDPRRNFKLACTLSHFEIIRMSKKNNWNNILIFEDDCIFINNFIEKIMICIKELKKYPWNLFYMGGEPNKTVLPLTDNLRVCHPNGGIYGTHAYAINNTFYDRILNLNPNDYPAIDHIYLHQENRMYVLTKELLVTQDDKLVSDLWGGYVKRESQYERAYKSFVI